MTNVTLGVCPAKPCCASCAAGIPLPSHTLDAIREAFVARVDVAAERAVRRAEIAPGMPANLAAASCWLAAHRVSGPASTGEQLFGWDLATSRAYLDGLDAAALADEMQAGHDALFGGRHPIARGVLDLARDLADAGERLATAEIITLRTADELRARWNANMAPDTVGSLDREAA